MVWIKQHKDLKLTRDQEKKCNSIIHGASLSVKGIVSRKVKITSSDHDIIEQIQISMITLLGIVFGIQIGTEVATSILVKCTDDIGDILLPPLMVAGGPAVLPIGVCNQSPMAYTTEVIGWTAIKMVRDNKDISITKVDNKEKEINARYNELFVLVKEFKDGNRNIYKDDKDYDALRTKLSDLYDEVKCFASEIEDLKNDLLYLKKIE